MRKAGPSAKLAEIEPRNLRWTLPELSKAGQDLGRVRDHCGSPIRRDRARGPAGTNAGTVTCRTGIAAVESGTTTIVAVAAITAETGFE